MLPANCLSVNDFVERTWHSLLCADHYDECVVVSEYGATSMYAISFVDSCNHIYKVGLTAAGIYIRPAIREHNEFISECVDGILQDAHKMTIMEHVSIKVLYHLLCRMLLFISAMYVLAQEHEPVGAQDERLSALIHQRVQEAGVPALSVSVTIKGICQRFVYGVAGVASQKANTLDTVYELGLMSKAFTGLVMQILTQEGRFRQGGDIIAYLPEMRLNYQGRPVSLTVTDFLYRTPGLPFPTLTRLKNPMPGNVMTQQLCNENLLFAPSVRFSYASANHDVLGAVIENTTRKTFTEVVTGRLTQSLGMSATVAVKGDEIIISKANGCKLGFDEPVLLHTPLVRNHVLAAYIHSTLPDMEV